MSDVDEDDGDVSILTRIYVKLIERNWKLFLTFKMFSPQKDSRTGFLLFEMKFVLLLAKQFNENVKNVKVLNSKLFITEMMKSAWLQMLSTLKSVSRFETKHELKPENEKTAQIPCHCLQNS